MVFKTAILATSVLFYETIANLLPRPVFYWPMMLYPLMGSAVVAFLLYIRGPSIRNGIDSIARSIDAKEDFILLAPSEGLADAVLNSPQVFSSPALSESKDAIVPSILKKEANEASAAAFDPVNQLFRLAAAVATLGSGCSLGPEGSAVEIGAGMSRMSSGSATIREKHHLFLAGTAAGVSAGFNAPIAGYPFLSYSFLSCNI